MLAGGDNMWVMAILIMPIVITLVILNERFKSKEVDEKNKEATKTVQNIDDEYNELIQNEEETNVENKRNKGQEHIYYDDTVSDVEIEQALKHIKDNELTANELIFLKFMNNKDINLQFSSRWEYMYDIKPRILLAKLLKLEYLTYSNWYDNVKNSTTKDLKEILKQENLPISGKKEDLVERVLGNIDTDLLERTFNKGKYILTQKGNELLKKNKRLFMSDREKAGKEFAELTDGEYGQLQVFHKINEYKRLKNNELSFEKGYAKNDILWSIYNTQILEYLHKKDYVKVGVVYDCMCDILDEEEKYKQEIDFLVCSMYFKVYEMLPSDGIIGNIDYYESRIKKHCKTLKKTMKNCNQNIEDFNVRYNFIINEIKKILEHYIQNVFLDFEKISMFQQKINKFLDT